MADITGMLQAAAGVGGYEIERSLRFNSADSAYLNRTPASAGNRKTWTWSSWVKRSALGTDQILFRVGVSPNPRGGLSLSSANILAYFGNPSGSSETAFLSTSQVFRDVSAWYHIMLVLDTTQATASNRIKMYVNGSQITAFGTATYPPQNEDGAINIAAEHLIGQVSSANYLSGYLAEIHFIDGQALTPSSFGETDTDTGVWQPKAYTGSYGTNGFFLPFSDNTSTTTLGYDAAGSNDWTLNNFSVTAGAGNDSLVDTPTPYGTDTGAGGEVRGNYCTLNPLDNGGLTLSNGNLDGSSSANSWKTVRSTLGMSSGKWYWEMTCTGADLTDNLFFVGIATNAAPLTTHIGAGVSSFAYYNLNGSVYYNGGITSYGNTWQTGDVIGVAYDADNAKIWFAKNGTWQNSGNPASGTNAAFTSITAGTYFPAISPYSGDGSATSGVMNFGSRPFAYTAPSGFKALCTQNLPTPTIGATSATQAGKYFNPVLYTGNDSARTITGVGFQPDFTWIKIRSAVDSHYLFDVVRGKGSTYYKTLFSNATNAESAGTSGVDGVGVTDFASDGFTFGSGVLNGNQSPYTFVAWNWKANGAGSSNTDGSITSTVSANTTAGFSIVTYTGNLTAGATVGHGLGAAPQMVIVKERGATRSWIVYHVGYGATKFLTLNTTDAEQTYSGMWNNTAPSSTVFTIGSDGAVNTSSGTYVAYCFAPVAGFSAFGSYTGNGSADGPFVYTGFRPAFVLVKNSSSALGVSWQMRDNRRVGYNPSNAVLYPNLSNAEYSTAGNFETDFLSNGFKIRNATDAGTNASGDTYIYAAFAEVPAKFSLAR